MATYDDNEKCPKCGCEDSLRISGSTKTGEEWGQCLECGYYYDYAKIENRYSLDELNEIRAEYELEELKTLPKTKNN